MDIVLTTKKKELITIQVGDIHMKGKKPENRKDEYKYTIIEKIKEIIELAYKKKADAIFLLGDIFDSHTVSNSTFALLYNILKESKVPIYAVVGNHDELGESLRSYKDGSLGLLEELGALIVLQDNEKYYFIKENIKMQVTVKNYDAGMELDKDNYIAIKENECTHAIHLVHGYLAEKPLIFQHTLINSIWDKTEANVTYAGHYHLPFDIEHEGKRFINSGSISRVKASLSEFRMPNITIQTIKQNGELSIEYYGIKCAKNPEDVLDRSKIEEENKKQEKRELFIVKTGQIKDKLKNTKINAYAVMENLATETNVRQEVINDAVDELSDAKLIKEKRKGIVSNEEN